MKLDFPNNELRSSPFSIPYDCIHFQLSSIWVTRFLQIRVKFNITRFIGYRVTLESNLHTQIPLGLHLDQSKQLEWVFEPSQGNSISNNRVMLRRTRYLQHGDTLKTTVYTQIPLGLAVDQSNYLGWVGKPSQRNSIYVLPSYVQKKSISVASRYVEDVSTVRFLLDCLGTSPIILTRFLYK